MKQKLSPSTQKTWFHAASKVPSCCRSGPPPISSKFWWSLTNPATKGICLMKVGRANTASPSPSNLKMHSPKKARCLHTRASQGGRLCGATAAGMGKDAKQFCTFKAGGCNSSCTARRRSATWCAVKAFDKYNSSSCRS